MHAVLTHAVATGHVLAGGCSGCDGLTWFTWLLNSIWSTVGLGAKVGLAIFLVIVVLTRRTLAKFVVALLLSGLAYWGVVGGGVATVANMIGGVSPHPGVVSDITGNPSPAPSATTTP